MIQVVPAVKPGLKDGRVRRKTDGQADNTNTTNQNQASGQRPGLDFDLFCKIQGSSTSGLKTEHKYLEQIDLSQTKTAHQVQVQIRQSDAIINRFAVLSS